MDCLFHLPTAPSVLSGRRQQRFHDAFAQNSRPATERLFLAVLPPPDVAARIGDLAFRVRTGHALSGKPLDAQHLHIALCPVGEAADEASQALVERVAEQMAAVPMPAFSVAFDRVTCFRNGAVVLAGGDSAIGLEILQQRLSDALDDRPAPARRYVPHVTLLRDRQRVPDHEIAAIEWTVDEVVLARGALGRTTYRPLARLPLVRH